MNEKSSLPQMISPTNHVLDEKMFNNIMEENDHINYRFDNQDILNDQETNSSMFTFLFLFNIFLCAKK